jgi:outer membrane protein TolC
MLSNKIFILIIIFLFAFSISSALVSAEEIDLKTALESALENNSSILAAEEKLKAAENKKAAAESIMNSKLRGEIAWQDEEITDEGNFVSSLTYSKLFAESKGTKAKLNQAELDFLIANLEYQKIRDEILHNVIKQYYLLLKIQKLIEKQETGLKEAKALYKDAELRFEDSLLTEAGLLRLEINLDKSRQALKQLNNQYQTASEQFKRMTGISSAENNLKVEEEVIFSEKEIREDNADIFWDAALNNRSDYLIQILSSDNIESSIDYLESEKRPTFTLGGEYNFEDGKVEAAVNSDYQLNVSTRLDTIEKEEMYISLADMQLFEESEWKITAAVSYEFSDGGKKNAEIKSAQANLNENEIKIKDLEEEIKILINAKLRELAESRERIEIAAKNLKRAELEYKSTEKRFKQGAVTESALISAQSLLEEAETENIEAKYSYELKKAELLSEMQIIYKELINEQSGGDL